MSWSREVGVGGLNGKFVLLVFSIRGSIRVKVWERKGVGGECF